MVILTIFKFFKIEQGRTVWLTWKLISKCVWTEVGWSNQTNVDKISAPSQEGTISISKWLQIKFRYLHPWVTFPFGFYRNSKEIYWFQIEPVWHDIISFPPEYISLSHSFRKRGEENSSKLVPKILPEASFMSLKRSLPIKRMIPTYLDGRAFNAVHRYKFSEQEWYVWWCDKSAYSHIKHHICCGRGNLRTFVWSKN